MALSIELSDESRQALAGLATARGVTPEALVERWVRERLAHEAERAAGGGRAMSPRSRREEDEREGTPS